MSTRLEISVAEGPLPAVPSVLLVDDDASIRDTFSLYLEHSGFETVVAGTVDEALGLIDSRKFDVVVSDLHLPEAGVGWTIVSAIRKSNPYAVTIIFSASPTLKEVSPAVLSQTDEVLAKPASGKTLTDMIRHWLKRKGAIPYG